VTLSLIEEATQFKDYLLKTYTWQSMYENRVRPRDWDALMNSISSCVRKTGHILNNDRASDEATSLEALGLDLNRRYAFFENVKKDIVAYCEKNLSEGDLRVMKEAPKKFLSQVVMTALYSLTQKVVSKEILQDRLVTWERALSYGQRDALYFSLGHLGGISEEDQIQGNVVLALGDIVWRFADAKKLVDFGKKFAVAVPVSEVVRFDQPIGFKGKGWCPQAWLDMMCLRFSVLAFGVGVDGETPSSLLMGSSISLVQNMQKISARMKSHYRPAHGSSIQHGKVALELMHKWTAQRSEESDTCTAEKLATLTKMVEAIKAALAGNAESMYDVMVNIVEDTSVDLIAFGSTFGPGQKGTVVADSEAVGENALSAQAVELAKNLYQALVNLGSGMSVAIEGFDGVFAAALSGKDEAMQGHGHLTTQDILMFSEHLYGFLAAFMPDDVGVKVIKSRVALVVTIFELHSQAYPSFFIFDRGLRPSQPPKLFVTISRPDPLRRCNVLDQSPPRREVQACGPMVTTRPNPSIS